MRSWLCSEQVGEEENDGCFKHDFPFRGRRAREPRNGLLIGTLLLSCKLEIEADPGLVKIVLL